MSSYEQQAELEMWEGVARSAAPTRSSTERAGYRRLEAKYAGVCDSCAGAVAKGDPILYNRRHELRLLCLPCGARADSGEELEHLGPARPSTRERLEAKAEKRRAWAESRAAKADAAHAGVHAIADGIPFGQPILVGHHSERHARRDQDRIHNGMRRTVEHADMAKRHSQAADTLEAGLSSSIYDDDADALEQLEQRIAGLEAKRETMKARNAEYRKAHRAELQALTAYGRSQAVPHAPYELENLSGNLSRQRQRLQRLRRQKGA